MTSHRIAYPADEAFTLIGISRSRGYQAIRNGELASYLDGKRRQVTRRALEEYVARRERESNEGKAA